MTNKSFIQLILCAFACMVLAPAWAATVVTSQKRELAAAWSEEGLQKVPVKGLDVVYARPHASLGSYKKIILRPVSVAFRRNWSSKTLPGSNQRISAKDSQGIKDRLSGLVREELVKQLTAGGYQLVDEAGDDVLDVTASVANLDVTAPDVPTVGRVNTYAVSAGEMSLVADLRDSVTGDIVMRVFDHAAARESSRPMRITNAETAAEARALTSGWAKALREALDVAKSVGAQP